MYVAISRLRFLPGLTLARTFTATALKADLSVSAT